MRRLLSLTVLLLAAAVAHRAPDDAAPLTLRPITLSEGVREVVKEYETGFGEVPGQCEGAVRPLEAGVLFKYVKPYGPERETYDAVAFASSVKWSLTVSLDAEGG